MNELPLAPEPLPLRLDEGGVVRIGRSRISLDLVVEQYENGMRAEDLIRAYDTLYLRTSMRSSLTTFGIVTRYIAYLKRRTSEAQRHARENRNQHPRIPREELVTRRSALETANAPFGQ